MFDEPSESAASPVPLLDALDEAVPAREASLRKLVIDGCFSIGDRGVVSMAKRCRGLKELSISVCELPRSALTRSFCAGLQLQRPLHSLREPGVRAGVLSVLPAPMLWCTLRA